MQILTAESLIDIEQHFKVVAGPGAGKTTFLVNHIKNVLRNSVRLSLNRKIACITYTNVGVDTLVSRVGDEKDHIEITTIHSFLFTHVVKPYLFLLEGDYDIKPEKFDSPFEHIPSAGYFRNTNLPMKNVDESELKGVYWEIKDGRGNLRLKKKNDLYHTSLLKYKTFFWEKGIIHYDDILAFAWEIMNKDATVLRVLRAKFPYFFIDEFQDTSPIQTAILEKIAEEETKIGVIGDEAQSIYNFQGSSMQQFIDFTLPSIVQYKIQDNHRSTIQILDVLKVMRPDLPQNSPDSKVGNKPKILIGDSINALDSCESELGEEQVVTLSYMVPTANAMKKRITPSKSSNALIEDLLKADSNRDRRKAMISTVKAVEYAKQNLFSDAIKVLSYLLKDTDEHKGKKTALILIKRLLNNYDDLSDQTLWDLYNDLKAIQFPALSKITESRTAELKPIEKVYKETTYKDLALAIRLLKDDSMHRTIHKAKGDEFDNVLVVVKGKYGNAYKEDRDLGFLLSPKLNEQEDHRVNYVACSRAKKNLTINVPEMSDEAKAQLSDYFEIGEV